MKVTPVKHGTNSTVTMSTKEKKAKPQATQWWTARNQGDLCQEVLSTVAFMKENQNYRARQAAIYARLYGNMTLFNFMGPSVARDNQSGLPTDRPTFNLIQSAADTLISRISQNRPQPVFLTNNGDYKQRNLAKKLNNFVAGEFHATKAYEKAAIILRDALVEGTGCLKVYATPDHKVALERVLLTELFTDPNDSIYGEPRQLHQIKLMDRAVLAASIPDEKSTINKADAAYPDHSGASAQSSADQVMVVESWHLPSGKDSKDGRHVIACSSGIILDESYEKDKFPFIFLHYSSRLLGFWAQGLAEQLMGTQLEINALLYTISRAIKLVGVPRVFVESGSKVVKSHNNNEIGTIITYTGIKPSYEVAQCVPQELYAQLQRLIDYGYQQCGVSAMQASAQKPAGLNSGEAIRSYDDISNDRFASLSRKYDNFFIELAYLVVETASQIAEDHEEYKTIYPGKNGIKEIDLPAANVDENPYIIQCFNMSSLPRDPAGRMAKITEMIQAGMISIKEGRRLLDYPDLEQVEMLANASEERIFQILDAIIEEGEYTPPDPFMDLNLAGELVVQYYNLYAQAKLEESKADMLRNFFTQVQDLKKAATPPPMPAQPGANPPQASPMPLPSSPLVPNAVATAPAA